MGGERVELRGTQRGKVKVEWWERGGGGRRARKELSNCSLITQYKPHLFS